MLLEVKNLHVKIDGREIVKGVNLHVNKGEVVALMGPNGSGKSTLANSLMGHPKYEITEGQVILDGTDITSIEPNEKAKKGLFLSFQYPAEINGVTLSSFLRAAYNSVKNSNTSVISFLKLLKEKMNLLKIKEEFANRYINEGFSGGEKKRAEILQLAILEPKLAILDETDSGLDVDALKIVAEGVNAARTKETGVLIITHYQRILNYIQPDRVYIMKDGKIIKEGKKELAKTIEEEGYGDIKIVGG